jgi:hypothetical protein
MNTRVVTPQLQLIPYPRTAELPPEVVRAGAAAVLAWEDAMEDDNRLSPMRRLTCRIHRRWLHECVFSSAHVSPTTGHRWCRRDHCVITVIVDELARAVTMVCPRCGSMRLSAENLALVAMCRRSAEAAWSRRHVRSTESAQLRRCA